MKLVFAGTPEFAAYALEKLIADGHEVALVLTQPDRPAGRGRKLKESEVKQVAKRAGIPVLTPQTLNRMRGGDETAQVYEEVARIKPDLLIVAAYGLILPQEMLDLPKGILHDRATDLKAVNIHGSLLPQWRGAAPIARGIEAGDKLAGVTLMQMDAGLDTGPMLYKKSVEISTVDTAESLTQKVGRLGAEMLSEYLVAPENYLPQPQPEGATYANKLQKTESVIDWSQPAVALVNKIRAFNPFPATTFKHADADIKVWFATLSSETSEKQPGTIIAINKKGIEVVCGDQHVACLEELQRPGGKKLKAADFLRGYPLAIGEILK